MTEAAGYPFRLLDVFADNNLLPSAPRRASGGVTATTAAHDLGRPRTPT